MKGVYQSSGWVTMLLMVGVLLTGSPAAGQERTSTVYLEDSPAAQELLAEAAALREEQRLGESVQKLQELMMDHPQKLMEVGEDRYEDALYHARRLLLADEPWLEAYRRTYTAAAERELELALSGMSVQALERVSERYGLTRPGLEATLALGGYYLERADGRSAAAVLAGLEGHPDLEEELGRYVHLRAVAAMLSGELEQADRGRERLRELEAADLAADLETLGERLAPPRPLEQFPRGISPAVQELPGDEADALWEVSLAEELVEAGQGQQSRFQGRGSGGGSSSEVRPVIPAAGGDLVLLNENSRVRALDRSSGWEVWVYEHPDAEDPTPPQIARMMRQEIEPRTAMVHGDGVFAVLGEGTGWRPRWQDDQTMSWLVKLDRESGDLEWMVEPEEVDSAFRRSMFQGTLLAGEERLYALVRRSQTSGFQDTFLVALDRESGEPVWRRHVSSTAIGSRHINAPPAEMSMYGGTIYINDNLGAVAAVDSRGGAVRWVHVFRDEASALQRTFSGRERVKVMRGGPVLVEAGLVVPAAGPTTDRVLLLDPATGEAQQELMANVWKSASQILPAGGDVLAVGPVVTLFDGATLDRRWSTRLNDEEQEEPQGMAAVGAGFVAVSGVDEVMVLGLEAGEIRSRLGGEATGHLLVYEGQLVVGAQEHLRGYMSWEAASGQLRARLKGEPTNPQPGLAMAHLAMRAEREADVLAGVDHAMGTVDTGAGRGRNHERVFDQLLELTRLGDGEGLREELFDRLGLLASGPRQEVTYLLEVAGFEAERGRVERAAEHLQAVLTDPALSRELYESEPVSRQARLEARARLRDLVEAEGREIYERFDREAERRLSELRRLAARAEAFEELANRYPLSLAANEALMEAARLHQEAGRTGLALRQLRRAYRQAEVNQEQLAEVVGRIVELYASADQPRQALGWLQRVHREHPELEPMQEGEAVSVESWSESLSQMEQVSDALPGLALPMSEPRVLEGRLLVPRSGLLEDRAAGLALTQEGQTLRLFGGADLEQRWSQELEVEGELDLVSLGEERVVLWSGSEQRLLGLDTESGERAWPADVDVQALLAEAGRGDRRGARLRREQQQFIEMIEMGPVRGQAGDGRHLEGGVPGDGVVVAAGEEVISLVDGQGRVVGVERGTGEVRWRTEVSVEEVGSVTSSTDTLAIGGLIGGGTEAEGGRVAILDMNTGELRFPMIEDKQPARWLGFAGEGTLLIATETQVAAYELGEGTVAWRMQVEGSPLDGRGWADSHLVILLDSAGSLLAIDPQTGERRDRMGLGRMATLFEVRAEPVESRWHVMSGERVMAITGNGNVAWRDAIAEGRRPVLQQLVGRDFVAVLARDGEGAQRGGGGEFEYRLYLLDRHTGSLVEEHPVGPLASDLSEGAGMMIDGYLLFAMDEQTLVLPGAGPE